MRLLRIGYSRIVYKQKVRIDDGGAPKYINTCRADCMALFKQLCFLIKHIPKLADTLINKIYRIWGEVHHKQRDLRDLNILYIFGNTVDETSPHFANENIQLMQKVMTELF